MTATYYLTLTDHGAQRVAAAHGQAAIMLVNLVLGDASGQPYDPVSKKNRTTLVNPRASVPVQSVVRDGAIAHVTATIDSSIGGFNIHEIGLTDSTGQLVYIGNYHGGYKPLLAQGASGELAILIDIKADSGSQILIQISPNIVTANKQWVLDNFVLLSTFNAHVAQNQLEHNNLLALITAEGQARGNADNAEAATRYADDQALGARITNEAQTRSQADAELEADTYALSVATENALEQERQIRAAGIQAEINDRASEIWRIERGRLVFIANYLQNTPYVSSEGAASGIYSHSTEGYAVNLYSCLTNPYLINVTPTPDYNVNGITLGHNNNKTGFLLKFIGFIQLGCYAEQGDTSWSALSASLRFYDESNFLLAEVPLNLVQVAGSFTNNSNVGHVTYRIDNDYDLYPLFKSNGFIPNELRMGLKINASVNSDGGSAARSVFSIEKFSVRCVQ